ncbi:MAG TPA: MtnX-like HAD-IB family phosphatase [Methylomirabilota bacterium]|nr:MtnX-like HAD-IB family phosphatase [Methylomirabilota bacterium]
MNWQVICDFDGTIANEDVTDGLLERFAEPAWVTIEAAWRSGEISARECMARQIDLLQAWRDDIDAYLATVDIDPEFAAFAEFCRTNGLGLRVVSDGLDYVIHNILRRHRLDHLPVIANKFEDVGNGRYRLRFPNFRPDCESGSGTCKCAAARQAGAAAKWTLLIGDGASDYCLAASADFVFAKGKLLTFCQQNLLLHRGFADFGEARKALASMLRSGLAQPFERTMTMEEGVLNG